jgi:hypothetical protein
MLQSVDMSLEIDLLNTYPVCGHEPNEDSDVRLPEVDSPPNRAIASGDSRPTDGGRSPNRDKPVSQP